LAPLPPLRGSDRTFNWVQLTFLGVIVAIPFSTELLAEFITFRVALLVYWANIFIAGITLGWSLWHMRRAALLRDGRAEVVTLLQRRLVVAQLLYFFGATLCVFSTYWSIGFIIAVQLYYTTGARLPVVSRTVIGRSSAASRPYTGVRRLPTASPEFRPARRARGRALSGGARRARARS